MPLKHKSTSSNALIFSVILVFIIFTKEKVYAIMSDFILEQNSHK